MNEDFDWYVYPYLSTGHTGYVSGSRSRKRKNPIGFALPAVREKAEDSKAVSTDNRLPKRTRAKGKPRARVTKSTSKRKRTTNKR